MRKLETETFGGKDVTVYLTESQWRGLLRRFNEEEIHRRKKGYRRFYVSVPCALCVEFAKRGDGECRGCPLAGVGCLHLVERHGSEALSDASSGDVIEWHKDDNKEIRRGIRELRRILLGMPRVRRVK